MASERLFEDHHLPEGMRIATNTGKSLDDVLAAMKLALEKQRSEETSFYRDLLPGRSNSDKSEPKDHTDSMNDITREEIDTKLQLIEERLDRKVSDIAKSVSDFKTANQRTVDALQSAKWWSIGTAIALLAVFMGTLQWGLSAQKEENARFSGYIREDIKSIGDDAKEISRAVTEMKIRAESKADTPKN